MTLDLVGFILDTLGTLMIAYTAIRVHHRFWKEHKMGERVFAEMKREQIIGIIGMAIIIIGAALQISAKL